MKRVYLICLIVFCKISFLPAQDNGLYSSELFRTWSKGILEGKGEEVKQSVLENQTGANPHPLGIHVLVQTMRASSEKPDFSLLPESIRKKAQSYYHIFTRQSGSRDLMDTKEWDGTYNDYYELAEVVRNIDDVDALFALNSCTQEMKKYPESFQFVWLLADLASDQEQVRKELDKRISNGYFKDYPAYEKAFKVIFGSLPQNDYNKVVATREFLSDHSEDAMAYRYIAKSFESLELYDSSAVYFKRAIELDPFYYMGLNMESLALSYAKAQDYQSAKLYCDSLARIFYGYDDAIRYTFYSKVLTDEGNKGLARTVLEDAIKQYQEHPEVNFLFGSLELNSKRPEEAIPYLKKAFEARKNNTDWLEELIQAYDESGQSAIAISTFNAFKDDVSLTPSIYRTVTDIFSEYGENYAALDLIDKAVQEFPYSSWMLRQKAKLLFGDKKYAAAAATFKKSFTFYDPYSWSVDTYIKSIKNSETGGVEKAKEAVEKLLVNFPYVEDLWKALANEETEKNAKVQVWERALEQNPYKSFPLKNLRQLYLDYKSYDKAIRVLEDQEETILSGSCYESQVELYFEKGIVNVIKLRNQKITRSEYEYALGNLKNYLEKGGRPAAYYQYAAELFEWDGNRVQLAVCMEKAILNRPDNHGYIWKVNTSYGKYYGSGKANKAAYDYYNRDPYDKERLNDLIFFNSRWYGTPLNCLNFIHLYRERFSDEPDGYSEAMAYGQLGANTNDFEIRFSKSSIVGRSYRYINWYNTSRKNAWNGSAKVELDYEANTATIYYPDGTIAKRQDDLRFGKITLLQIGDQYVKGEYNNKGSISYIGTSAGKSIRLDYNDQDKIIRMEDDEERVFEFDFDENGNYSRIRQKGLDDVKIYYNAEGELDSVRCDGGYQVQKQIFEGFQKLLELANTLGASYDFNSGTLPKLGFEDEKLGNYRKDFLKVDEGLRFMTIGDSKKNREKWLQAGLVYARYLYLNTHADADYGPEAITTLSSLLDWLQKNDNIKFKGYGVEVAALYHQVLIKVRKRGVAQSYWNQWIELQEWLQLEKLSQKKKNKYNNSIESLQEEFNAKPVELLSSAEWLPKSMLQNEALWRKYPMSEVLPRDISSSHINCIFKRSNGDVVLGTEKGIVVLRRGYWEWFAYNGLAMKFEQNLPASKIEGTSNVLSLAENSDGELFIGTGNGLIILDRNYKDEVKKFVFNFDGLESKRITHLAAFHDKIIAGSMNGTFILDEELNPEKNPAVTGEIKFITSGHNVTLISSNEGTWLLSKENSGNLEIIQVSSTAYDDGLISAAGEIFVLNYDKVFNLKKKSLEDGAISYMEVELLGNVIKSDAGTIYGLNKILVHEDDSAPGVLTDLGISIYHQNHYEHFFIPFSENRGAVKGFSGDDKSFCLYNQNDVLVFERDKARYINQEIKDIVSMDSLGLTFFADGSNLKCVRHNDPESKVYTIGYYGSVNKLEVESYNQLLVADGLSIVRYTFDKFTMDYEKEELFYSSQYEPSDYNCAEDKVNELLVASDGTIWVAAGASVFRYRDVGNDSAFVQEFNYFRNEDLFPSKTYFIDHIIETNDGRVFAVGSNEGHIKYRGMGFSGGLLIWDNVKEKFSRSETLDYNELGFNWFITSYTSVSEEIGIYGSSSGFGEDFLGNIKNYTLESSYGTYNSSYQELKKNHYNLFLGTEGAKLGDLWLFGCGEGVVAWLDGVWFYPDRLNQLLPDDQEFGKYGSRKVNAIATDAFGNIYVGTDRGLMVYDSEGTDATSFLMNSYDPVKAVIHHNEQAIKKEKDLILSELPNGSNAKSLWGEIEGVEKEMNAVKRLQAKDQESVITVGMGARNNKNSDSLTSVISDLKKKHADLLLKLQEQEPGLYQLVSIPPLDLFASRDKLKEGECIIQYIPLSKKLFIQVLSKDKISMKEVMIDRKTLMDTLTSLSKAFQGVLKVRGIVDPNEEVNEEENTFPLNGTLQYLYSILIKPVEEDISKYKDLFVVPSGALSYMPFSALISDMKNGKPKYLVEDFNIGYLSSMYLFNLVAQIDKKGEGNFLLLGDPDGTLPGARAEVEGICGLTNTKMKYIGRDASTKNFMVNIRNCRMLHLATHGYLDRSSITNSWLLFSDKKFKMNEIYGLDLGKTEMVILSACESASGKEGLEFATLARAFSNAGVPSIMATLWEVNDEASKELMIRFYKHFLNGKNKFESLAAAQRELISSGNRYWVQPEKWAAYIPIGKP